MDFQRKSWKIEAAALSHVKKEVASGSWGAPLPHLILKDIMSSETRNVMYSKA